MELTIKILDGLKSKYEQHHEIVYEDDAIVAAAKLSEKHVSDRCLPDKAIDLLDESGSQKHLALNNVPVHVRELENEKTHLMQKQNESFAKQDFQVVAQLRQKIIELDKKLSAKKLKWEEELAGLDASVSAEDIANVVATWTGIPVNKIKETEKEKLVCMEDNLHKRVVGQNNAIIAISNAIRRNRAGLKEKNKPIGSFLFLGPTGVGKTGRAHMQVPYPCASPRTTHPTRATKPCRGGLPRFSTRDRTVLSGFPGGPANGRGERSACRETRPPDGRCTPRCAADDRSRSSRADRRRPVPPSTAAPRRRRLRGGVSNPRATWPVSLPASARFRGGARGQAAQSVPARAASATCARPSTSTCQ